MNNHDFESLLESVLLEDSNVEPSRHLEENVLRRLAAPDSAARRQTPFLWAFGVLAACLIVFLLLPSRRAPSIGGEQRSRVVAFNPNTDEEVATAVPEPQVPATRRRTMLMRQVLKEAPKAETLTVLPKQDVFPSPSLPSDSVRELIKLSRRKTEIAGLNDADSRGKAPTPLKVVPIHIAAIEIEPLFQISTNQTDQPSEH